MRTHSPLATFIAAAFAITACTPKAAPDTTPETTAQAQQSPRYLVWQAQGPDRHLSYTTAWVQEVDGKTQVQQTKQGLFIAAGDDIWQMKLIPTDTIRLVDTDCYSKAREEKYATAGPDDALTAEDFAHCETRETELETLTFTNLMTNEVLQTKNLHEINLLDLLDEVVVTYRVLGSANDKVFVDHCLFQSSPAAAHPGFECSFVVVDLKQAVALTADELGGDWQTSSTLDHVRQQAYDALQEQLHPPCDEELPDEADDLHLMAWWPDWSSDSDELKMSYRIGSDASWACSSDDWSGYSISTTIVSDALSPEVQETERQPPQIVQNYWKQEGAATFQGFSELIGDNEKVRRAFEEAKTD